MSFDTLLNASDKLKKFADKIGKIGSVFILPLVFFTMWDVLWRKLGKFVMTEQGGLQVWLIENAGPVIGPWFESTKIQEWEWHWHTALFALVLGYGYVHNRHVRVDLIREKLPFKAQAGIEFIGCSFFMVPYCAIVSYFAYTYALDSFITGEISASTVGLSNRWIIKSVLVIGLLTAMIAGIAVWLQTVVVLLAPKDKRFELMTLEWPEEAARKQRIRLDAMEDRLSAAKKEAGAG